MICIPFPSIVQSAVTLTKYRIGSTIRDIYHVLNGPGRDPMPKRLKIEKAIWADADHALALYGIELVWQDRRLRSNGAISPVEYMHFKKILDETEPAQPWWWGIEAVHTSHLAYLIQENPLLYRDRFGDSVPGWENIGLIHPLKVDGTTVLREN